MASLHRNAAIQATEAPTILIAHPANQVQRLGVVGYDDDLVGAVARLAHLAHEAPQDEHLAAQLGHDGSVPSASHGLVGHELGDAVGARRGGALLLLGVADLLLLAAAAPAAVESVGRVVVDDEARVVA